MANTTKINYRPGQIAYLCSVKTSAHTYCTSNAKFVTSRGVVCIKHTR